MIQFQQHSEPVAERTRGGPLREHIRLEGRLRQIVFALLRASGAPFLFRHIFQRRRLTILLLHPQTPDRFERTARILKRRYTIISLGQALDALEAGSIESLPERPLAITFDDGRASNLTLVPMFTRYDIRPTIFVATGIVGTKLHFWWSHLEPGQAKGLTALPDAERIAALTALGLDPFHAYDEPEALSIAEIKEIGSVADIEPHTRTHPILPRCPLETAREEIAGSLADVEEFTGTRPRIFAYPNGDYSDGVVALVKECGLRYAVTTEPVLIDEHSDPLRLGRIFVRDDASTGEIIVFASGLQGTLKRLFSRFR